MSCWDMLWEENLIQKLAYCQLKRFILKSSVKSMKILRHYQTISHLFTSKFVGIDIMKNFAFNSQNLASIPFHVLITHLLCSTCFCTLFRRCFCNVLFFLKWFNPWSTQLHTPLIQSNARSSCAFKFNFSLKFCQTYWFLLSISYLRIWWFFFSFLFSLRLTNMFVVQFVSMTRWGNGGFFSVIHLLKIMKHEFIHICHLLGNYKIFNYFVPLMKICMGWSQHLKTTYNPTTIK